MVTRAMRPAHFDDDLDVGMRIRLARTKILEVDSTAQVVRLSALFHWYWADFRRDLPRDTPLGRKVGERVLLTWLEPYLPADLTRRFRDGSVWRVEFLPWDGSLNDAPGTAAGSER